MSATVYSFLDIDGTYLYIGCTEKLRSRVLGHRRKPWWPQATTLRILAGPTPLRVGLEIERHLIETLEPLHNVLWTHAWRTPRLAAGEAVEPRPLSDTGALVLRRGYTVLRSELDDLEQFWQRVKHSPVRSKATA